MEVVGVRGNRGGIRASTESSMASHGPLDWCRVSGLAFEGAMGSRGAGPA